MRWIREGRRADSPLNPASRMDRRAKLNPPYASLLPDFLGGCRRRVVGRDPVRDIWYRLRIGTGISVPGLEDMS